MPEHVTIGVDIGGTKVAAGLVDASGEILHKTRVPMVSSGDAAAGFHAVVEAIKALPRKGLAGIGLCSPGPLDPRTGVVLNPPNLPCWRNFPLAAEVERTFHVPARVDNDANAAGLAEALWGAGVGYRNVFYGTLGTGIGGGIIFNKKIYHGRTGSAAEAGHVTIDYQGPVCACGKRGCIEVLCAGPAIALRARARIDESHIASRMLEMADGFAERVTPEHVGQAWRENDALAMEVLDETADLLAVWLGNIVDLLEPDVIVIGGGMSGLMQPLFGRIVKTLPRWCINPHANEIPLVPAHYGADAGIAGAAALVSH